MDNAPNTSKSIEMRSATDPSQIEATPIVFSNHTEVKGNANEIFITFALRQDHAVRLIENGIYETSVKALVSVIVTPDMALKLGNSLIASVKNGIPND